MGLKKKRKKDKQIILSSTKKSTGNCKFISSLNYEVLHKESSVISDVAFSSKKKILIKNAAAAAAAKLLQSCPTLCDPIDSSPSGSPIPGILQARTLEWVAISFSNAWKWKVKVKSLSHVPTVCDPMDCSLPGFSVHAIAFSSKNATYFFNEV